MTAPREVIAGRTLLISRRCTQRQFLLRPDANVEQIYLYCLGEAAARYRITLHGWTAMGNHHHLVIRDNLGNYPEFLAHLHKMLAKALNAYRGRWENFWATEQPSAVWTVEASDGFDKLVYLLVNPVADDLVERVTDWPGASSLALNLSGSSKRVKRPRVFFREHGAMPEEVELRAERLESFVDLTQAEWQAKLLEAVGGAERRAREARWSRKSGVLGRRNVLRMPTDARPTTIAPRRSLRPNLACRNPKRRALELGLLRAFRAAYRAALALWRRGDHSVAFPEGTYRMRWFGALASGGVRA